MFTQKALAYLFDPQETWKVGRLFVSTSFFPRLKFVPLFSKTIMIAVAFVFALAVGLSSAIL